MARKAKKSVSDRRQLEMFVERVQELADTRMMRERQLHKYHPRINWDIETGVSEEAEEPDEDDLKSFLLTFRHFVMKDEPTYFYNVVNTASKCLKLENRDRRSLLSKARDEWQRADVGLEKFIVDRQHLKANYVLDLYINGKYFHNDPDLADRLKDFEILPIRLDKMRFLLTLQDFTRIINQVGYFVANALEHDWFDLSDDTSV
ncbi:MAG: hypothetical protein IT320_28210 [Anaerolineae bacterium]|nr:hypothetical protein [Anaerolineae bacterium]